MAGLLHSTQAPIGSTLKHKLPLSAIRVTVNTTEFLNGSY